MYTVRPKRDPMVAEDDDDEEGAVSSGIPMHPSDWDKYVSLELQPTRCERCGVDLVRGTHFGHCVACLATRRIDEPTLIQASAGVVEGLWPLSEERLDARRWAHALITLWRGVVDPMLMRAFPYASATLEMTLMLMKQRLRLTDAVVWLPDGIGDGSVVVRARGETLALSVTTKDLGRNSSAVGLSRDPGQARLDVLLKHLGLVEGWLIVEKISRRARRDDPVKERTVISPMGYQIHRMECSGEIRF